MTDTNVWLRRIARSLRNLERIAWTMQNGPGPFGAVGNDVKRPGPIENWEREDDPQSADGSAGEATARRDVRALNRLREP